MTKRPIFISFIAYTSIIIGITSLMGDIFIKLDILNSINPIYSKGLILNSIYSILFISTGYFILKDHILGWQLGLFSQLLNVTKSYGTLVYIFINISRIDFDTNHMEEYLFKYAITALISMILVYYFLNINTLNYFSIKGKFKNQTLQYSILLSFIFIFIQIITHTISI